MSSLPPKLQEILEDFSFITSRAERQDYLIQLADRFNEVRVPASLASKPYAEIHRVQACESDAYVWAVDNADGTLHYYFDVLNPQGLSAMAVSVLLHDTLNGAPLSTIAHVPSDIIFTLFGKDVSMGKGAGLMGIVDLAVYEAKRRLPKTPTA